MHPLELLNIVSHILHARAQAIANDLLRLLIHVQETFNEFAVDEAERPLSLALSIFECSIPLKVELASRLDYGGDSRLKTQQKILGVCGDGAKEVDGALDLYSC